VRRGFQRPCGGADAGADRDRDPADLAVDRFDLPRVQACSDLEPQRLHPFRDGLGAPNPTRRSAERREESVSRGIDLVPSVPGKHRADHRVMMLQELSPLSIAELGRRGGRAHDVGEQNRGQHAVEPGLFLDQLAHETLNLPYDAVGPAVPMVPVEATRIFDLGDLGPRDARGSEATVPGIRVTISVRIHDDQRRDADGGEHRSNVGGEEAPELCDECSGRYGRSHVLEEPVTLWMIGWGPPTTGAGETSFVAERRTLPSSLSYSIQVPRRSR
jgi:hypothetical protein